MLVFNSINCSRGEPTLYPYLIKLVEICKNNDVEHIAISTNGSAHFEFYKELKKGLLQRMATNVTTSSRKCNCEFCELDKKS